MKPKLPSRILAQATLMPLLLSAPLALSAQPVIAPRIDPNTGLPRPALAIPEEVAEKRLDQVEFDSQPLSEVVRFLREQFPDMNFVVARNAPAEGMEEPVDLDNIIVRLKIHSAGLTDILTALTYAADRPFTWKLAGERLIVFETPPVRVLRPAPVAMAYPPSALPPAAAPPKPIYEVINLPNVLHTSDPDALDKALDQIRQVVDMTVAGLGEDEPQNRLTTPRLRYHEGSGLLVMIGSKEGIALVMDVIQNIQSSVVMKAGVFAPPGDQAQDAPQPSPQADPRVKPR